jgi:CheY-like chemotaxis protein
MKVPLVLVVDDDIGTTRFLVTLLEDHGYEVAGACSGADADARIAERVPDLLLLDLHLGDMDAATFSDGHEGGDMISRLSAFQARETNERLSK